MKDVTLRQLRVFEAVARHLSFSRAASELHLSQPAVSMQVRDLEERAGLPLTEQIGKKIFLTDAGAELARQARLVEQQLRAAEEAIAELRGLTRGKLNLAVVSTAKYFAPRIVSQFLRGHPGAELRLSVKNREEVLRELADYATDFAIMGRAPQDIGAEGEPFATNPYYVIAPPDHPLAKRRRLTVANLAEEQFLVREPGSGTRTTLERLFSANRVKCRATFEMSSNETIKQAVIAGLGISFLSKHTVGLELQVGQLVTLPVVGTPVVRQWYLVRRRDKRVSPMAAAFREFLLKEAGAILDREYAVT